MDNLSYLIPLFQLFEKLYLENRALRATFEQLTDATDAMVNANIEKHRAGVAQQFEVLYELTKDPVRLHEVLSAILKLTKPN